VTPVGSTGYAPIVPRNHPVFARVYERISTAMNEAGEVDHRRDLVAEAAGRVLEPGAGNGLNFAHYRRADLVVAMEPEPTMLRMAAERARRAPVPVHLLRGAAEMLPFTESSFDTVVASLMLCSVADLTAAIAEFRRVLRPGGTVRFLEHVRSRHATWATVQDAVAGPWSWFAGGCHPNRDSVAALRDGGFEVRGRGFPFGPPSPCRPHVLGVARLLPG
jgi:ubiquinone/menaquinone biosynthesis C-methylase UbiE